MPNNIAIENIVKNFGSRRAVDGLSLEVGSGELFGLIGPDGAGKTTLIRMLVGLMLPDGGSATVAGFDVVRQRGRIKEVIGYLSQQFSLYPDLSVEENIRFYGDLFRVERNEMLEREKELLGFSRLEQFRKRRAGALSGGMKQKLALCATLIHVPDVLFLDEPTTGVDPVSRREFWDILGRIREQGTTVFVSTAYMDEADRCDRVALMYGGSLLEVGEPRRIPEGYPSRLLEVVLPGAVERLGDLEGVEGVRSVQVFGDRLHISVERDGDVERRIADALGISAGRGEREISEIKPGLEDVFVDRIS